MQLTVHPSNLGLSFIMSCNSPPQAIQGHVGMEMQGKERKDARKGKARQGKEIEGKDMTRLSMA
jgi:hypothetical protein